MQLLPASIVLLALVDYRCHRASLARRLVRMTEQEKTRTEAEALHLLFRLTDVDRSGRVDPAELVAILRQLGWTTTVEGAKALMAVTDGVETNDSGFAMLPEDAFVESMVSGNMAAALEQQQIHRRGRSSRVLRKRTTLISSATTEVTVVTQTLSTTDKLVRWTLKRNQVANALAGATQLLLLAHTPVSRKVFQWFHCRDMAGRPFLRADYRIRCYEDEWNAFTPIVLLVLCGFTAALPTFIGFYLWRNRAELYSTRVYQTVGFLYAACECCVFVFLLL